MNCTLQISYVIKDTFLIRTPYSVSECLNLDPIYVDIPYIDILLNTQAMIALSTMDTQGALDVFDDLVQATSSEDEAQLPQDLDATNDIITGTLDLLFSDLEDAKKISSEPSVTTDEVIFMLHHIIIV